MNNKNRCAIYTRKSSEEGLEQSFNSLDAQREACEAYIHSQKHEGWQAVATHYDDGGYSGGNMERPALKQLIEDITAGKVNKVVVYKVDRLTRSLADFAKIIERFDAQQVNFVSVTQQFNTTTSMGRLTLNVLLSFAQFEREVTGERIRDKIAASKKKGMWMGGRVPLGYELRNRMLHISTNEAVFVRNIFEQYLRLGNVRELKDYLDNRTVQSNRRAEYGKAEKIEHSYSRGALYQILRNHLYVGEIEHKGNIYTGQHEAIVDRALWSAVQKKLTSNHQGKRIAIRTTQASLLTGLLFDTNGTRYTPTHSAKNKRRYRYYTSQAVIRKADTTSPTMRIPAHALESAMIDRILKFLQSPDELLAISKQCLPAKSDFRCLISRAEELTHQLQSHRANELYSALRQFLYRVVIDQRQIEIQLNLGSLMKLLGYHQGDLATSPNQVFCMHCPFESIRYGKKALRLIIGNQAQPATSSTSALVKAIARSRQWYEEIVSGKAAGIPEIAERYGHNPSYVARIFHFAFLGPEAVEAILDGRIGPTVSLDSIVNRIPLCWSEQSALLAGK